MMSTSACRAIRASNSLYGSPAAAKIGSFCDSTSELNTSIIGIPVRTILRGMMRLAGLTDGPPMGMRFSSSAGPLSRGCPEPLNTRPSKASVNETSMVCPRKRTWPSVAMPRLPANTCKYTLSLSRRITCASETPSVPTTCASSPFATPLAVTVITLPAICSMR